MKQNQGCGPLNMAADFDLGQERCLGHVGVGVCLYCSNFIKQGRVGRTAGEELYSDAAWKPRGMSRSVKKDSEKEGKELSTSALNSSLTILCAQRLTSPFCCLPFFLKSFERTG